MPGQNASVRMGILQITTYKDCLFIYFYRSAIPRHFHYQGMDKILQGMSFYTSNPVKVNGTAHMSEIIRIFKSFQAQIKLIHKILKSSLEV